MWTDNLSQNVKEEIIIKNFNAAQLDPIKNWPAELVELIFSFKFGKNKVLQLIDILNEISLREGKPIDSPLKSPEWLDMYNNPKIPIFQKGLCLRQFLLSKRYPIYTELRNKIKSYMKKLKLTKNISIDNEILTLENNTITFKILCKQPKDLQNAAQKLMEISNSDELQKLLDLLKM